MTNERLKEIAIELATNVWNYRKSNKSGRNYITLDRVIYDTEEIDFEYVVNVYYKRLIEIDNCII